MKVVRNTISYKKVNKRICLSLSGVEVGATKTAMFKYYNVLKTDGRFTLEPNAAEKIDYMKKCFE